MRKLLITFFSFFFFSAALLLTAAEKFETTPGDPFGFHTFKLGNGLTVILARNTDQPEIQSYIMVRAGSMNDPIRSTGLAHYFEHLMFKGSSKIAALDWEKEKPLLDRIEELFEQYRNEKDPEKRKTIYAEIDTVSSQAAKYSNDEYWDLLRAMGCSGINAFTSYDITAYETTLPAHKLEQFLTLEAERFSNVSLRRFHTELETVYEEFNHTQDSDSRQAFYALMRLIAGDNHPAARPVIGLPEHLKNPSIRDIKAFFKQYYVPSNIVLILTGDLDHEKTATLIRRTFGKLSAGKPVERLTQTLPPLSRPRTADVTGPEGEFLLMAYPLLVDPSENGYIRDLIFTVLSNGKNGIFDVNLRKPQKVQSISCGALNIGDQTILYISAKPLKGQTMEQLRALIETEIGNLKAGNFDPAILAAAVNNDRLQLMTMAESFTTAAEVALELSRQRIGMNEVLADLKKSETVTKDIFVQETNRILTSAPAVVYKRSGEKTDRIHAEKPPITPVQIPEAVSPYAMELAQIPSGTANGPEVIDWETAITETPVSDTKLYSTKNERNERFVFTIEFPAGRYHDLYHALALDYLTLIGTDQKDLAAFDSELYKLALNLQVSCGNYTSGITVSGLQKYLPQAIELLAERLTQVKSDPDAFHRYVERIKKSRADAKKNPNRLFSGAISRTLYGEKCPALHQLMTAELEQTDPAELTARLRDLCRTMPRNFIYYGPGDPRETASLIRKYFPEPDKNLRKIPEPVKFKIVPPAENTVCVIRHPAVQVLAGLIRPGDVQIPADTAFELLLDSYSGPLFFTELREKQALGYVAQASYSTPAIQPDNYATFMAILGTQNDKLAQGMKAMRTMTDHLPQDLNRYRTVRENAVTSLLSQRIKPEHRYFFRQDQQRLNLPLDQAVRDLEQIRNTDGKAFFKRAEEIMNRHKDIWILSGGVKEIPPGFGKVIELKPEDLIPE